MIAQLKKWIKEQWIKAKIKNGMYTVSPSGQALLQYIFDKYINGTNSNNYIEKYEQTITEGEEHTKQLFTKWFGEERVAAAMSATKDFMHLASAVRLSGALLAILPQERREALLDTVQDTQILILLKAFMPPKE